jgi:hypothetical protein
VVKILNLHAQPVLGRIHAINRKHRLRSKHYAAIEDWPESGASVDVLDAASLDAVDHYPCADEVLVVSDRLLEVLRSVDPQVESFALDAGGRTVHVVLPVSEDDVMYESDGHPDYSVSGYNVIDGTNLRVDEAPDAAFCCVRNTGLLAISATLEAAAREADVRWTLHDVIDRYGLERRHPYLVCTGGYAAVKVDELVATSDWPEVPPRVPHPLGSHARDPEFEGDPDSAWLERITDVDDEVADAAQTRYSSGLPLPAFEALLEEVAKSRLAKRWKATLAAGLFEAGGLAFVSASIRDRLLAAGVEARFERVPLSDRKLGKTTDIFLIIPEVVVDWIDWSRSDVGLRWNGMIDEYFDLEPSEASYTASAPLVRVAGSNLILIRESLRAELSAELGFQLVPLHERRVARNLDDCIRAR